MVLGRERGRCGSRSVGRGGRDGAPSGSQSLATSPGAGRMGEGRTREAGMVELFAVDGGGSAAEFQGIVGGLDDVLELVEGEEPGLGGAEAQGVFGESFEGRDVGLDGGSGGPA